MRPQLCVDLVQHSDRDQMYELRATAYRKQYGQDVDISVLHWNSWDERFINLGVFEDNKLISVLRIAHVKDSETYQKIMLCDFENQGMQFPVIILSRASTHESYLSKGYHSLLRYHAFNLASKAHVNWVVGTLKQDSERLNQMADMGYELSINPEPWGSFLKSHEPTYVAKLNISKFHDRAITRLKPAIESILSEYPAIYDDCLLVERMKRA